MIDDISVIVLELGSLEPEPAEMPPVLVSRKTIEFNTVAIPQDDRNVSAGVLRGDVIRGSYIPAKDPDAKKPRFDPKRGSYANKDEGEDESKGEAELESTDLEGIPFVGRGK